MTAPHPQQQGLVRLSIQGNLLSAERSTPQVRVNGYPVPARRGTQDIPVWAGRNRIEVSLRLAREYAQAEMDVDVPPGAVVPVYYAPPYHPFTDGAIGYERPKRPGLAAVIAFQALGLIVPVTIVLLTR